MFGGGKRAVFRQNRVREAKTDPKGKTCRGCKKRLAIGRKLWYSNWALRGISARNPGVAQLVARLTGGQEAASSSLVTRTIVGAKSALLRRLFMPAAKKTSSARSLAPPLQITTAYAGLRFGFRCASVGSCIFFGKQTQTRKIRTTFSRLGMCSDFLFLWRTVFDSGTHPTAAAPPPVWEEGRFVV